MRRLVVLLPILLAVVGCGSSAAPNPELLFVSTRDGDYAIYGVGGGREHRLTKGRGDPLSLKGLFFAIEPAWSSDDKLIAFSSRRDGVSHLYVMHVDGTNVRRITHAASDDRSPTWSPDRRRIAFARDGALFVVPAAGGPARRLSRGIGGGDAADPAWSPDGKLIAYDYRPADFSFREIWIVDASGGHPRPVTKIRALSMLPSWSPGGRHLAFQSNSRGGHFEIYSCSVDGSGLRRETRSAIDTIDPAWSPNGKEIAFSRDGAIWTVDRAGGERKITSGGNDSAPVWRPAGAAK